MSHDPEREIYVAEVECMRPADRIRKLVDIPVLHSVVPNTVKTESVLEHLCVTMAWLSATLFALLDSLFMLFSI